MGIILWLRACKTFFWCIHLLLLLNNCFLDPHPHGEGALPGGLPLAPAVLPMRGARIHPNQNGVSHQTAPLTHLVFVDDLKAGSVAHVKKVVKGVEDVSAAVGMWMGLSKWLTWREAYLTALQKGNSFIRETSVMLSVMLQYA